MAQKKINLNDFLPTIHYWARHYAHRSQHVLDFEDLVVVGQIGLMDAARKYRDCHGTQFKTYAEFRIRGEIIDELRRQDWMSRSERKKQKIYRQAQQKLEQNLCRPPTCSELAKVLPFKAPELEQMRLYEANDMGARSYQEGDIDREHDHDTVAMAVEERHEMEFLIEGLPPLHQIVIRMRYYDEASVHEIADEVGLSEGRVSQMHHEALGLMKKHLKAA